MKSLSTFQKLIETGTGPEYDRLEVIAQKIVQKASFINPSNIIPPLAEEIEIALNQNVRPSTACRLVTTVADKLIDLGVDYTFEILGHPPRNWMLMLMGSEGRFEQTLRTDQDSAIVYEGEPDDEAKDYFTRLGTILSDGLNGFGYLYCKGNVMVSNPKWVMALPEWNKAFKKWVEEPEPIAIMQACIFFDLRTGYGNSSLGAQLGEYIFKLLSGRSGLFFYHMAQNALTHRIPLGIFGGISRKASKSLDIKKVQLPITDHARIHALKNGIKFNNTLKRIQLLNEQGNYKGADAHKVYAVFEFLLELRLRHQIHHIKHNKLPDNIINPSEFDSSIKEDIVQSLRLVRDLQQNIGLHFRAAY